MSSDRNRHLGGCFPYPVVDALNAIKGLKQKIPYQLGQLSHISSEPGTHFHPLHSGWRELE